MALTVNTKVILVDENVDLTQRKDALNNGKVEITTVGELLTLLIPAPPASGDFYLKSEDGVIFWELPNVG